MLTIENRIAQIAEEIKPGVKICIPDDAYTPLLGSSLDYTYIECCYLVFEVMKRFKISVTSEDLTRDDLLTIAGLSNLVKQQVGS